MANNSNNASDYLNPASPQDVMRQVEETERNAECACWRMKGVDRDESQRLGVGNMVQSVLSLLQKVDGISMDIVIAINRKSK